ncbi:tetratricopeptide repeat protein [Maridesulfovibrio sp.]|uniref:tetratricopeptide repeat protein n=1 Tax=unclassified Maridesulfovibrio TaxID=2794999 RepID=UPI003B00B720
MKKISILLVGLILACSAGPCLAKINSDLMGKAKQGDAQAQHNLATLYEQGKGVTQDEEKAFHWFYKSAMQGLWTSQANISYMYSDGRGVPKNNVMAYAWMSIADASGNMATGTERLKALKKEMTPAQIAEGQQQFAEIWRYIQLHPSQPQLSEDQIIKLGKEAVSLFQCATIASIAEDQNEHSRLFYKGYFKIIKYLDYTRYENYTKKVAEKSPLYLTLNRRGPSSDFCAGSIYSQIVSAVYEDKELEGYRGEARKQAANNLYRKRNCELLE